VSFLGKWGISVCYVKYLRIRDAVDVADAAAALDCDGAVVADAGRRVSKRHAFSIFDVVLVNGRVCCESARAPKSRRR